MLVGSECFEDTTHIGILQGKTELDAEKAKAHIPYLPKRETGFVHSNKSLEVKY